MYRFTREEIKKHAPNEPGIYFLLDRWGEVVYIGQSQNIRNRLVQHTTYWTHLADFRHNFKFFGFKIIHDDKERLAKEKELIEARQPHFNNGASILNVNPKYLTEWQRKRRERYEKAIEHWSLDL